MSDSVMPTYARAPLSFIKGQGCWLETADGQRYLDLGGGVAVNALGHAHPDLVAALTQQAGKLWHTSNLYHVPNQQALADGLTAASFADKVFMTNSGTEAMECAIKTARKFHHAKGDTHRNKIITFSGAFHGRTLGMISAAGNEKLTTGFAPLLDGFIHLPFGDHDALKAAIDDTVGAIVVEPIQGEGGIIPVPEHCLRGLREICDRHGLLLIFDEIQCGMGRTGKLFAHEWAGITPDIMALAKGIGGGFPLGACLTSDHAASGMTQGTHGSTYGGNPLACAVGLKVLEIINTDTFLSNVVQKAQRLRDGLITLVENHPNIFELLRGTGLMLGLKCKINNMDVVNAGYDVGVLSVPAGNNVVRLLPPLTINNAEIDEGLARLEQAARTLEAA